MNEILRESNVDSNLIQETDYVCDACYKTHLSMLKHADETYDNKKLMTLIESWKTTLPNNIADDTRTTLHTVLHVANEIIDERVVLLPNASQLFISVYTECNSEQFQNRICDCEGPHA